MADESTIWILGAGAVGFPLAAYLTAAGRHVVAVRTSRTDVAPATTTISVTNGIDRVCAAVETASLAKLADLHGTIVVATKAYANHTLAQALRDRSASGPIVLLQNGIGVEQPFVDAGFGAIYRCVLYVTAQPDGPDAFVFRPVTASPVGVVTGDATTTEAIVAQLSTTSFPFRSEPQIEREVWKKAIINTVFNSICPLLDADNGVFVRDAAALALAREVIAECLMLTDRRGLDLTEAELLDQIVRISTRSDGQLISTLQDLKHGRPTEIAFLNLAIAKIAAALDPQLELPRVALLGRMIQVAATQRGIES